MTDIATKGGAVIFKDGAAAENCECCGGWWCYDYAYCVCTDETLFSPRTRKFHALVKWTITQPSYGRYVNTTYDFIPPNRFVERKTTLITRYAQSHFANSFFSFNASYGGDDTFPGGTTILVLTGGSQAGMLESCQYSWFLDNPGFGTPGSNKERPYIDYQNGLLYFYHQMLLDIACTKRGYVPQLAGAYPVGFDQSESTVLSGASWAMPGLTTAGRFYSFSSQIGSLDDRVRMPPQPDLDGATITKTTIDPSKCFGASWEISYPVKKWSLVPSDPSQVELLTVGSLLVRVQDVSTRATP